MGDSDKPDVIVYYDEFGTIIDNKSYSKGFSVDRHCADEMIRYVNQNSQRIPGIPRNEWWKRFGPDVTQYSFLFITSFLKGRFKDNIEEISMLTGIRGGAIGVESFLYLAESLKTGKTSYGDFPRLFTNDEIKITA